MAECKILEKGYVYSWTTGVTPNPRMRNHSLELEKALKLTRTHGVECAAEYIFDNGSEELAIWLLEHFT